MKKFVQRIILMRMEYILENKFSIQEYMEEIP